MPSTGTNTPKLPAGSYALPAKVEAIKATVEGAANSRRVSCWQKDAADGAAATATAEVPFYEAIDAETVTSIDLILGSALTADANNKATIIVRNRTAAGALVGVVAQLVTDLTTGNLTAFVTKGFGAVANTALAAGNMLTVEITKQGTGVVVPPGVVAVGKTVN